MFWTIGSIPEVHAIPEPGRSRLLREHASVSTYIKLIGRSLFFASFISLIATSAMAQWVHDRSALLGGLTLFPIAIACIYLAHLVWIRGQLCTVLGAALKRGVMPVCLRCGYWLEGLDAMHCPECGAPIVKQGASGNVMPALSSAEPPSPSMKPAMPFTNPMPPRVEPTRVAPRGHFYWRISDIPEVQAMPEPARSELLKRHASPRTYLRLTGIPAVLSLFVSVSMVEVCSRVIFRRNLMPLIPFVWVAYVAIFYLHYLRDYRKALRRELIEAARCGDVPLCLHCAYWLEGVTGNRCPECGTAIDEMHHESP